MLANQGRELEAVEVGHADVDQHDRDVLLQQMLEGLLGRVGHDEVFPELAERDLVAEQLRRLVVDQQDVDLVVRVHSTTPAQLTNDAATSAARTGAVRCSPAWRDSLTRRPPGISR